MTENHTAGLKEREIPERMETATKEVNKIMKMAAEMGIKIEFEFLPVQNIGSVPVKELKAFCWKKVGGDHD